MSTLSLSPVTIFVILDIMPVFNTSDKTIRTALFKKLGIEHENDSDTAIIPELGLPYGTARVDIAVVNGVLHGYELKGDLDNLLRLRSQKEAYNLIFDKVTLVVCKKHFVDALHLISEWWGITVAKSVEDSEQVLLIDIRRAQVNPKQDINMMVSLLWKDEIIELFKTLGETNFKKSRTKKRFNKDTYK